LLTYRDYLQVARKSGVALARLTVETFAINPGMQREELLGAARVCVAHMFDCGCFDSVQSAKLYVQRAFEGGTHYSCWRLAPPSARADPLK